MPLNLFFSQLNRPSAFNALSAECLAELHAVLDACQHPPSMLEALRADAPRVIVLSAAGRAFCGGVDIKARRAPLLCGLYRRAAAAGISCARPADVQRAQRRWAAPSMLSRLLPPPPAPRHNSVAVRRRTAASAARPGTTGTCARSSC